jgi:ubiquinone/menaquinone biosynthesis C-methylase UbiE
VSMTESGTSTVSSAWDRYAIIYQNTARLPTDVVSYGAGVGTEAEYRLLGLVSGKRVLDLGCGGGQSAIAFAKQGAIVIGVDISVEQLAFARRLVEEEEVRVELRQGDLAELAFQRADTVDIVFSAMSLQYVPDLNRVFRQVHRVLRPQGTFVFSLPHPASALFDNARSSLSSQQLALDSETPTVKRSYFDKAPLKEQAPEAVFTEYPRTISDIFMGLLRAGYRVDTVLEPEIGSSLTPQALIIRARKEA